MTKTKSDEYKIDYKFNLKFYFDLVKKYKRLSILLIIIILIIESSHVLDKYLFKLIIDKGTDFNAGILEKSIFIDYLLFIALIFVSVILVMSIFRFFHSHIMNRLVGNLMLDLKKKFFNHIVHLDYNFHQTLLCLKLSPIEQFLLNN